MFLFPGGATLAGCAITASTSSLWTGDTGNWTFTGDNIASPNLNSAIRSTLTFTGDFYFTWIHDGTHYLRPGVYPISEDATFSETNNRAAMNSMTNSVWLEGDLGYSGRKRGNTLEDSRVLESVADGDVIKFERVGSTFKVYDDGVLDTTWSYTTDVEMRVAIAEGSDITVLTDFTFADCS
jgi:hypothetical protein